MKYDISESVRYIGADDKTLDLFEGKYTIPDGVSYNSYLIIDEKIAIMDTIDIRKTDEWMDNLLAELGGRIPDYVIVSHMEPDHAASLQRLVERFPDIRIVGNAKTFAMIPQFFDIAPGYNKTVVSEGDTLPLGRHTLQFFMAPMVHWPEVMVAYEQSEKILFSADGFGKFGALDTEAEWDCEARRYYFNIVGKYGAQVQALLKKAATLDIRTIAPLHGPILRENLGYYIEKYDTWSSYRPESDGVFIACASIYGNTAKAAHALAGILKAKGAKKVSFADLARDDMAEAVEDAFRYDKLVVAASTYDGGIFTPMADFLSQLAGKNYQRRKVAIIENGSWAPMAGRKMREIFGTMKEIDVCENTATIRSAFKPCDVASLEALADELLGSDKAE